MTSLFPNAALIIFGLIFLCTGVMSFLKPADFARSLSLEAVGRSGRIEVCAQYGGFFFAAALSQFAPFLDLIPTFTALIIALVIFGGLIFGRLGGLFFSSDGEALTPMIRNLFWVDIAGTIIAIVGILLIKDVI